MSWRWEKIQSKFTRHFKSFSSFREVWIHPENCCWLNYPKRGSWYVKHRQLIPFCCRKLFWAHIQRKTSVVARLSNHKICKSSILQFPSLDWFAGFVANLLNLGWLVDFIKILFTSNFHGIRLCSVLQSDVTSRPSTPNLVEQKFQFWTSPKEFLFESHLEFRPYR